MFEKIRNLKNKKGFTLVELIVVLVILAILAALLVPALTGYIDKANKQKIIAETRQAVMAAQTIASEQYAKGSDKANLTEASVVDKDGTNDVTLKAAIKKLGETTKEPTKVTVANGKVTYLEYTNGKTCKYDPANSATNSDGEYNVS
ncbi:type II secretion system protein [Gemmiger sp.]|uniref:type II secretion system protein n=1 Tax=Gemmiger sp. TaxID=2049027 RepID=UPI003A9267B3